MSAGGGRQLISSRAEGRLHRSGRNRLEVPQELIMDVFAAGLHRPRVGGTTTGRYGRSRASPPPVSTDPASVGPRLDATPVPAPPRLRSPPTPCRWDHDWTLRPLAWS